MKKNGYGVTYKVELRLFGTQYIRIRIVDTHNMTIKYNIILYTRWIVDTVHSCSASIIISSGERHRKS